MIQLLIDATEKLLEDLRGVQFQEPVTHVYNPLEYAFDSHRMYLEKFAASKKRVLMMGMNPGPYGMAQTGVPFGEIPAVSEWMGINALVKTPENEHPKRPIQGEVSGRRLWGLFAEKYPKAEDFFKDHYVTNFIPLIWMAETGRNITPDKVKKQEMGKVLEACDAFITCLIELQQPEYLIGVGAYAEKQLKRITETHLSDREFKIGKILHPSPASPLANKGWAEMAEKQLIEQGIW